MVIRSQKDTFLVNNCSLCWCAYGSYYIISTGTVGKDLCKFESIFPLLVDTLIDCTTGIAGLLSNESGGSGYYMGGGMGILYNLGSAKNHEFKLR